MPTRPSFTGSIWFVSLIALTVALATKLLLESVIPIAAFDWFSSSTTYSSANYRVAGASYWLEESVLRLVAFGSGGAVASLLARSRSKRLMASLVFVSLAATVFAQFPGNSTAWQLSIWSLSGPVGALLISFAFTRNERNT